MGVRRSAFGLLFGLCLLALRGWAEEGIESKILAVFHPYRQDPPRMEGITPGMKIDQNNCQVAREVLPLEILKYLQAGDFAITVQETTDMPLRQEYIKATLENHGKASLGEGELKNHVAGRPFPLIDPQDPQAGLKVAWNYRYRDRGETAELWPTVELRSKSGAVERTISFYIARMQGMHRPDPKNHPEWEKEGIFSKQYVRMLAPSDMEGRTALSYLYDKDTLTDDQWAYDPRTRRVRKVVYNPYEAWQGEEFLIEDIAGFSGYIHPYEWKYLGEKVVLAPGPIRAAEPRWGGKGNWYPVDPWELRRAVVVEARPKEPHPVYSRRVLYIDLQTYVTLYALAYDHADNHMRTFFQVYWHPDFNPWNNEGWIPLGAAQPSIDYQRERAAVFQAHKTIANKPLDEKMFTPGALMRYGK